MNSAAVCPNSFCSAVRSSRVNTSPGPTWKVRNRPGWVGRGVCDMLLRRVMSRRELTNMRGREHEIPAHARRSLGGLEFFHEMIAGELPLPPLVALLGIRIVEVEVYRCSLVDLEEPYGS